MGIFFAKTLLVPADNLNLGEIEKARRIEAPKRRTRINNEVLVTFKDVGYRDFVMSHTKNIPHVNTDRPGVMLDYPEFLEKDFRLLEAFGARMRARLGEGFKRSIKFDDDNMRLFMDLKLPESPEWMSITPEIAQEAKIEEDKKKSDSIRRLIQANESGALDSLFREIRMSSSSQKKQDGPYTHNRSDFPTTRWGRCNNTEENGQQDNYVQSTEEPERPENEESITQSDDEDPNANELNDANKLSKQTDFNILLTNARSLSPKIDSLINYITEHDIGVSIVSESWLKPGLVLYQEIGDLRLEEKLDLFHFSRKINRRGRSSGGGVAILCNRKYCSMKGFKITRRKAEIVCVTGKLYLSNKINLIILVLLPSL